MPERVAPGVYVEETSIRSQPIEGVSTSTAAFVGLTRRSPTNASPQLLTSFTEYERYYGGFEHSNINGQERINDLAHAVHAYFENGGRRLYLSGIVGTGRGVSLIDGYRDALDRLLSLDEVSIVAAPGASRFAAPVLLAINQALIGHAESTSAYRFAVLDTPPDLEPNDVRWVKDLFNSKNAALYYPWLRVANPLASVNATEPAQIDVPPSGFLCGIYARSDTLRGVNKAPANEVVTGALSLQRNIDSAELDVLNPLGVNCIREVPNQGVRVWGARTLSSEWEWKYVNVRRYFLYLEASIERGTQWVVGEPNNQALWDTVKGAIGDFLYNEWRKGALPGAVSDEAYFVRCDRSTMSQDDIDSGRLICLIGVATVRPAEFVTIRISRNTLDCCV